MRDALVVVAASALWLIVTSIPAVSRHGFAPDEELTAIVVSASPLAGTPVLPSGVVYLRGVAYLKLASLAGAVLRRSLPVYRAVSLVIGAADVVLIAIVAWRWLTPPAGAIGAVLLATSPLHAAVSTFARPYTLSLSWWLLGCLTVRGALADARAEWEFLGVVALAQTTHEAGGLLVLIPLALAVTLDRGDARRVPALRLLAKTLAIAIIIQYVFGRWFSASVTSQLGRSPGALAFSFVQSIRGPAMYTPALAGLPGSLAIAAGVALVALWLRRATRLSWLELAAGAALAASFLLGSLLALAILGVLAQPRRVGAYLAAAVVFGVASTAAWTAHTVLVTDAALSLRLAGGLARSSLAWPFDWVRLWLPQFPITAACAAAACLSVAYRRMPARRLFAVLTWLVLLAFGAVGVVEHDRYASLVMPILLAAAALAATTVAEAASTMTARHARPRVAALVGAAVVVVLCAAVVAEQRAHARTADTDIQVESSGRLPAYALRSFFGDAESQRCIARIASASGPLVCNDEPACRYLFGRVDGWLLPDHELRAICAIERDGVAKGIYAGSRILDGEASLDQFLSENAFWPVTIAVVNTPKFGVAEQKTIIRRVAERRGVVEQSCGPGIVTFRIDR